MQHIIRWEVAKQGIMMCYKYIWGNKVYCIKENYDNIDLIHEKNKLVGVPKILLLPFMRLSTIVLIDVMT